MSRVVRCVVVLLVLLGTASCDRPRRATLVVSPAAVLVDQPVHVTATGLDPGATVTLRASTTSWGPSVWSSSATFVADDSGRLDLDRATPQTGPVGYSAADGMGLFRTMKPRSGVRRRVPDRTRVTLTLSGHGEVLARRTVSLRATAPGLRERKLTLSGDGIHGTYFRPATKGAHRPAVVVFGGSEGGESLDLQARMLAVHGYPALSLAYFGEPGLPKELARVPVEYAARAVRYLARQPEVDPSRVAVLGASRGGELAELLGVHYPDLVHGVIALTPANVAVVSPDRRSPPWTWRGEPVPFTRQYNDPAPDDAPVIAVERIRGPVLATCGGDDRVWASCPYATALLARLHRYHRRYRDRLLSYPQAGHYSNGVLPYQPMTFDPQAEPDARARIQEWPVILRWLRELPAGER